MKMLSMFVVVMMAAFNVFSAGDTPIANLRLTTPANGSGFAITNVSYIVVSNVVVSTMTMDGQTVTNYSQIGGTLILNTWTNDAGNVTSQKVVTAGVTNINYYGAGTGSAGGITNGQTGPLTLGGVELDSGSLTTSNMTAYAVNSRRYGPYAGTNVTGTGWVALGESAGVNAIGNDWAAIGKYSGFNTGKAGEDYWVSLGYYAGQYAVGRYFIAVGSECGEGATGAYWNAVGHLAAKYAVGNSWTAVGQQAGQYANGYYWTAVGLNAGVSALGDSWSALGRNAGRGTTGTFWNAVGNYAGQYGVGNYNLYLGSWAGKNANENEAIFIDTYAVDPGTSYNPSNSMLFLKGGADGIANIGRTNGTVNLRGNAFYKDSEVVNLATLHSNVANEITVDVSGYGQFTSITQALAYVDQIHATNATLYVNLHIVAGRYNENPVFKGYTVLRGDFRRTRIYGNTTITGGPTFFDGFDFRTTDGSTPLTVDGLTLKSVLGNCYILNSFNKDSPSYGIVMTNSVDYLQINNTEVYTRNSSDTANAKAICIMASSGGFELVNLRLKTSSSPAYDNEYLGWFFGTAAIQVENCEYQVLHDHYGNVYLGDVTTGFEWMDSSAENNEYLGNFLNIYGDGAGNARFYGKEVGSMKVHGSILYSAGNTNIGLNVFSDGTNTFQTDVNNVTGMVLTTANGGVTNRQSDATIGGVVLGSYTPYGNYGLGFRNYNGSYLGFVPDSSDNLRVNAGGGDTKIFVGASGLIGIGTNEPTEKLHVAGNILASGTVTAYGTNTALRFQTVKNGVTSVVTTSKSSISNTVYSFWVGYEGEYISETNSTGGTIDGKMYFIRRSL